MYMIMFSYLMVEMTETIQPLVKDSKSLQLQLVKELLRFNDTSAAVKWVVKCDLPVDQLPYEVHAHLNIQRYIIIF